MENVSTYQGTYLCLYSSLSASTCIIHLPAYSGSKGTPFDGSTGERHAVEVILTDAFAASLA